MRNLLNTLILTIAAAPLALAAPATTGGASKGSLKTAAKESQEKKSKFSVGLSYSLNTDLAEQSVPQAYSHAISVTPSYSFNDNTSVSAGLTASYETLDTEVVGQDHDTVTIDPTVDLDLQKTWKKRGLSGTLGGGVSLPLSEDSRYEGVKAIPSASASLKLPQWGGFYTMSHSLSASYIVNTYEYSPTDGSLNQHSSLSYSIGNSFALVEGLTLRVSVGAKLTRMLDGSVNYSYNNKESLSYQLGNFSMALNYVNGGFTDRGQFDFWYINEYRRLVTLSTGYDF